MPSLQNSACLSSTLIIENEITGNIQCKSTNFYWATRSLGGLSAGVSEIEEPCMGFVLKNLASWGERDFKC